MPAKVVIPKSVLALAELAAKESTNRFGATTAIKLTAQNGRHRCEATNGRILGIMNGVTDKDCFGEVLVPAVSVPGIKKMLNKDTTLTIIGDKDVFQANTPTAMISGQTVDGRWPATDQVLPQGAPRFSIKVDPALLITLLKCAMAINEGEPGLKEGTTVKMHFYAPNKPFVVTARANDGTTFFDGIIVPLVTSN